MTQPTTGQLIEDAPTSGATISVCGTYRFHLWRVLPLPPIDHVLGRVDAPRVAGRGRVLGLTKHGHPKHPLYLRHDLQPQLWQRRAMVDVDAEGVR